MRNFIFTLFIILSAGYALAQTAPTNFVFTQRTATATNYSTTGYGDNYSTGTTYNVYFGTDASSNSTDDEIMTGFDIGGETYKPITLSNGECYNRVVVNRVANANVSDLDKQTLFFEKSSSSGNNAYFTPTYANIQEAVNTRIVNRGGDNVFSNQGGQTLNNIERIDLIIDGGVYSPDNTKAGFVINERGGNDDFIVAAITSLDGSGNVNGLGSLVSVQASDWGNTGNSVTTTVFQRGGSDTYMRPNQDLGTQDINSVFVSYNDLGINNNVSIYGIAVFPGDVNATMDLIGLSDVPLNTTAASNDQGGLDLMGGGGYFGSETVIVTDLEVILTADDMSPADGQTINLTVHADNNGPLLDSNIIVTTEIPSGFTYTGLSSGYVGNVSVVGTTITWTFDELVAYDTELLEIQLTTNASGARTFTSDITGDKTDINLGNNDDDLEIPLEDETTLPVTWLDFTAEMSDNKIDLNWSTLSEENSASFEVQSSTNAKDFYSIDKVDAAGNSNSIKKYSFTDYNYYNTDKIYYRLKQVDTDGRFDFSETISVSIHINGNIIVYPNPNTGSFKISGINTGTKVFVLNQLGAIIKEKTSSSIQMEISLDDFPSGIYFIRTSDKPESLNRVIVR